MLHLVEHPVAHDILRQLRDASTGPEAFRALAGRISLLLAVEALAALPTRPTTVTTPLGPADGRALAQDVVLVPVLRAGLGMLTGMLQVLPSATVGHIGLQRDEETAVASRYYAKLPPGLSDSRVILIDPMLATGGSAVAALDLLTKAGARHLSLVCIVAAPEGVGAVEAAYPHVPIVTPVVDKELNDRKFIVPGLGDFGDRLYGTL
ncbi:MAG: uracil phosphoribosyltransferase [Vicinamibacterales bacterium]